MPSSTSCRWLVGPLLLTSLHIGWSHDIEGAIAIPANRRNKKSVRVSVHGSFIELIIDNSSRPEQHQDLSEAINALTVSEELLCSMEHPKISLINKVGNELFTADELKNPSVGSPLKIRLSLVKGKSKQPLLFEMLDQEHVLEKETSGYGRRRRRGRGFFSGVKNAFKSVVKKVGGAVKNVVHKVKSVAHKVGSAVKSAVTKIKTHVQKGAKLVGKVIQKGIEHGKKALKAVVGCVGTKAIGCMANPLACGPAVVSAGACLKKKAHEIKEGVVADAIKIKDEALQLAGVIKKDVISEGHKVKNVLTTGVRETFELASKDAKATVHHLVDKSMEVINSADSHLPKGVDPALIRGLVSSSVTTVEKEALTLTTKTVADTGEKLGELKGKTESQIAQEEKALSKTADASTKALSDEATKDLKSFIDRGGGFLNVSESNGTVDAHAHPRGDQASLIIHANKVGLKDKQNKMMRHSVSWQGSFERI